MLMKCMGKIIFICHRWRGDDNKYSELTKKVCRYFAEKTDDVPLSTALYINQFLNDDNKAERELGVELGHKLMEICDIVYSYEQDGISDGMKQDLDYANIKNKEVKKFDNYPWG